MMFSRSTIAVGLLLGVLFATAAMGQAPINVPLDGWKRSTESGPGVVQEGSALATPATMPTSPALDSTQPVFDNGLLLTTLAPGCGAAQQTGATAYFAARSLFSNLWVSWPLWNTDNTATCDSHTVNLRHMQAKFTLSPTALGTGGWLAALYSPYYASQPLFGGNIIPINDNIYVYINTHFLGSRKAGETAVHLQGGHSSGTVLSPPSSSLASDYTPPYPFAYESDGWIGSGNFAFNPSFLINGTNTNTLDIFLEERMQWGGVGKLNLRFVQNKACTYTQGGWGTAPHGNNPGSILAANFPNGGFTIGDPSVVGGCSVNFPTDASVQSALPAGGTPGPLNCKAGTDLQKYAGAKVFGGQVLALTISLTQNSVIGSLTLTGTGTSLDGKTVAAILMAADTAIAGGALPAGFTYSSLNDLIDKLNNSFDSCTPTGWGTAHLH